MVEVTMLAIDKPIYPPYLPTQLIFQVIYRSYTNNDERKPKIVRYTREGDKVKKRQYFLDINREDCFSIYYKEEYKFK